MKKVILILTGLLHVAPLFSQSQIRVINTPAASKLQVVSQKQVLLETPDEGVWSVATGWSERWPAEFKHALIDSVVYAGKNTVLFGHIDTGEGSMLCRDAYRLIDGRVKCTRRYEWIGEDTLRQLTLTIRFNYPTRSKGVVMPGILYHGNPSGERSGRTPWYHATPGESALFEEHRFPMPFVAAEWETDNEQLFGTTLHSLPSPVPFGHLDDQWWSMGLVTRQNHTELVLYSGPCTFNGEPSAIKALQGGMESYDQAWMDIPPGTIIEKTFWLETYPVTKPGSGFQQAVHSSLDLFKPWFMEDLPSYREIIENKISFALSRYHEDSTCAGFKKYPDRNYFVLGWCGQSIASGYAMQVLKDQFDITEADRMIQKSLDFLSESEFYESGFYTWYDMNQQNWFMNHSPEWLSQGQAMLNFANAIRVGRNEYNTEKWESFLRRAATFHADRILKDEWKPESTNEAFFIEPLCKSYSLFNEDKYLEAAKKAAKHYADRSLDMSEPYWGGTLDASCEDKEGAFAVLQGFSSIYELTKEKKYLEWATHAGDVCLSYTVNWDIPMPPGRLTDHGFKSRGWTAVSVQNMHIDVYGVLIAPYIYKLGTWLEKSYLQKTGELMFRSCGQLIDPFGSQGEQPYQTNYIQVGWQHKPLVERRGNYHETWTVFWITAHFLNAAAMFKEMGIQMN